MPGAADPDYCLIEIATYPEDRLGEQPARDLMLVFLDRRTLPEVITLVLHPRGRTIAPAEREFRSRRGATWCRVGWPVIQLWDIPADQLLATDDVGLVPWIPLARIEGDAEPVIRRCREIIDRKAAPPEHENLLVVTQILASLRYNDSALFQILGGEELMVQFPIIEKIVGEATLRTRQEMILKFLEARFSPVPQDVDERVRQINDESRLNALVTHAARCADLDAFRAHLN